MQSLLFAEAGPEDAEAIARLLNATRHYPRIAAGDFVDIFCKTRDPRLKLAYIGQSGAESLQTSRGGSSPSEGQSHVQYFLHPFIGYTATVACFPEHVEQSLDFLDRQMRDLKSPHYCVIVADKFPALLQSLSLRGFRRTSEDLCQSLDLKEFQSQPDLIARLEGEGYRFISFDEMSEAQQRSLYELELEVARDIPNLPISRQPSYEDFLKSLHEHRQHNPCCLVAVKGNEVKAAARHLKRHHGYYYSSGTGVRRAERGKGLATAIKLAALQRIHTSGGERVDTCNEAENQAMLAINKRIGYQILGSHYYYNNGLQDMDPGKGNADPTT